MKETDARLYAAELRKDIPELDVHGKFPYEIEDALDVFLNEVEKRDDAVRIVYGIGKGALQKVVLECLHKHPYVEKVKEEAGSCLVLLSEK